MRINFTILLLTFFGCSQNSIDDLTKRNTNWVWWVDSRTGVGEWIPFSNNNPVKDGTYTTFYFNGNIKEVGKLKGGRNIDTSNIFDLNGILLAYEIFLKDTVVRYYLNDGEYRENYNTGEIFIKGSVKEHLRSGKWISYFKNGKKKWEEDLVDRTGWSISYHENGQVLDSIYYFEGLVNCQVKRWYSNGNLSETFGYRMGVLNGVDKSFYENGQLKYEGANYYGKAIGDWYQYDDRGRVIQKLSYENGNLISTQKY